jgi:glycosyltransferase involved in cell wall biosynthesis
MNNIPRIGYVPFSPTFTAPGDRRRFVAYAHARNLPFELARFDQRYDVVVLSEIADISIWSKYQQGRIVFDFIDSYLSVPRTNWRQLLRGPVWYALGKHKKFQDYLSSLKAMCRRANAVVCTTDEQRELIGHFCENVHVILDIHSMVATGVKTNYVASQPFRLAWEGLASNLTQLAILAPVLRTLSKHRDFELHVVSDPGKSRNPYGFGLFDSQRFLARHFNHICFHQWEEQTFSQILSSCDLAIIPIKTSDRFVTGKPENKLLLLWRIGLPVVAAATPAYRRAMQQVKTPEFACENEAQWIDALEKMMSSEPTRKEAATRGRLYAEGEHGAAAMIARWDAMFASLGFYFGAASSAKKT